MHSDGCVELHKLLFKKNVAIYNIKNNNIGNENHSQLYNLTIYVIILIK